MRGEAEANPEIPHFVRNRLRNLVVQAEIGTLALVARNDNTKTSNAFTIYPLSKKVSDML